MRQFVPVALAFASVASIAHADTAATTAEVVQAVVKSPWAKQEEGFKSLRVEFYSKAIFGFSVNADKSKCYFHFWREGRAEEMPNRVYDRGCDGTINAVKTFAPKADWEFRKPTAYELGFYGYYLPRYAAVFKAVNLFRTYLPQGKLALLPDLGVIAENKRILQKIANAATGSDLRGENEKKPNLVILKIWVNEGPKEGGYIVGFSADKTGGRLLKDCFIYAQAPSGDEDLLDKECDAVPEMIKNNQGAKPISAVGNEKVVQSLLLEVGRFADVANELFQGGEAAALAAAIPPNASMLIKDCRTGGAGAGGLDGKCLVGVSLRLAGYFEKAKDQATYLVDVANSAAAFDRGLAAEAVGRIPEAARSDSVRSGMARALAKAQNFDAALRTVKAIAADRDRAWALMSLSRSQAKVADWDGAEATANLIATAGQRAVAFRDIVAEWVEQNGPAGAERFTDEAHVGERRAHALALVGAAQAKAGGVETARKTFGEALAAADRVFGTADQGVSSYLRDGIHLYSTIAEAQADSGLEADALATLDKARAVAGRITDPKHKTSALRTIAWRFAELGKPDDAMALIAALPDGAERVSAAVSIHDDFPDPKQSLAALKYALKEAEAAKDTKAVRFEDIGAGLAKFGDRKAAVDAFTKALGVAEKLDKKESQRRIVKIARMTAEAGILNGAKVLVDFISDAGDKRKTLATIGAEYWKKGDRDTARKFFDEAATKKLDESDFGLTIDLSDIADIEARAGAIEEARKTLTRLEGVKDKYWYFSATRAIVRAAVKQDDFDTAIALIGPLDGQAGEQGQLVAIVLKRVADLGDGVEVSSAE